MKKRQSWNVIVLFFILIFGFTAATFVKPQTEYSPKENRYLAKRPALTIQSLADGSFEKNYETYLTDQFVLRDDWIAGKTLIERMLGRKDCNDVYFAADDYLIEKHTGVYDTALAEGNIRSLSAFVSSALEKTGAGRVTVMIVPNALSILEDKLPAFASADYEKAYLSKIREALPPGVLFDCESVLNRHKDEELYYRTDHHWKTAAAFYTFQEWAKQRAIDASVSSEKYQIRTVTENFEGTVAAKVGGRVAPDSIEAYDSVKNTPYTLTWEQDPSTIDDSVYKLSALAGRDQYAYFYGGNFGLVEASCEAGMGRRILVIKDSYAHCFVPFLYDYFDQVDMLDLRYFYQPLSSFMEEKQYTDVLILYNAAGFAEESAVSRLLL